MRTDSGHPALIKHDDLICMKDRTDTLRNDNCCRLRRRFFQCTPQRHICLIIKCRKTVIKNQDLRLLCNCPRNRKPLLLPTGYVRSALGDRRIIFFFFFFDKFTCLCDFGRLSDLLFRRICTARSSAVRNQVLHKDPFLPSHGHPHRLPGLHRMSRHRSAESG